MSNIRDFPLTDVTCAVAKYGGIEKAAKLMKIEPESLENYMATGCLPKDLAKKLSRVTGYSVQSLTTPV